MAMKYFNLFKKFLNPKGYVKSKSVGHKAVKVQQKKKKMLKQVAKPVVKKKKGK